MAQTTGADTVFPILQALTNVPVSWFEVGINVESSAVPIHRPNGQPSGMVLDRNDQLEPGVNLESAAVPIANQPVGRFEVGINVESSAVPMVLFRSQRFEIWSGC